MSGQSWPKRAALAVVAVLLATWSSLLVPGYALGAAGAPAPGNGGNNGTVKICDVPNGCPSSNDPHLSCPITIQWSGFDNAVAANPNTLDVTFTGIAPTGGTVSANGGGNTDHDTFTGTSTSKPYSLQVSNGTPNTKGEYHISIAISTTTANGSDFKQKTVWVGSCAAPATPPSATTTATCSALSATLNAGTNATTFAITVNGVAQAPVSVPANGTQTVPFTPAAGATISVTAPGMAAPATATAPAACGGNTTPPSATLVATCSALSATVNAGTNATTFAITVNGVAQPPVSVPASGSQTVPFTPAAGATITVAAPNMNPASATAPANCGGGNNPTPPNATATSTCSVASVHLDAGSNATDFSVTEPGGTHQVHVPANQTQDISYTPGAGVTISVSSGGTVLASSTSPAACTTPPGQAQPDATATDACITGITVVLSNMNGSAGATFTVTAPDGSVSTVSVNAGQLKKVEFAVAEDTTGVVGVTAPGGLAKTFSYKKNCTKVLGEKHTIKPPKTPTKVLGEKDQLPFTGFDAKGAIFDAASLLALGAIVCALASPRRRRFAPHLEG